MSTRVLVLLDNDFSHDARVERETRTLVHAEYTVTVVCLEGEGR